MSDNWLFILGAKDPEMDRIAELLTEHGQQFIYAKKDGIRVNQSNAYQADHPRDGSLVDALLFYVECRIPTAPIDIVIDHHRPGDEGYDIGPEGYFDASSLGQIYNTLEIYEVPQTDRILAAVDHCFTAAMQGKCPNVTAEEVQTLREHQITEALQVSLEVVQAEIDYYVRDLTGYPGGPVYQTIDIGDTVVARIPYTGAGNTLEFLTAQIAAARSGLPVLIKRRDEENGPVVFHLCGNASKQTVESFMNEWALDNGLQDVYGVPERGYAGAYVPDSIGARLEVAR